MLWVGCCTISDQPSPQGPFAMCALGQATEFVGFGNLLSINCVQAKHNILTKNGLIQLTWTSCTEPIIPKEVIQSAKESNDLEK